jgi:aerobic carbon-monoxide dehydrogenase large subunit
MSQSSALIERKEVRRAPKYVGAPIRRTEDPRLITGHGRYVDDIVFPGMLFCSFTRSEYAHARIKSLNTQDAQSLSGVVAVLDGNDLASLLHPLKIQIGLPGARNHKAVFLPTDKARFVGEPLVAVVAKDRYVAEDAAELVQIEYEPLSALTDAEEALKPGSVRVYEEWDDNVYFSMRYETENLKSVFARADHVYEERFHSHRHSGTPLETRGAVFSYDPYSKVLTGWMSKQDPYVQTLLLADALGIPPERVRVITQDVGGGFGVKLNLFAEEAATAAASRLLGRPIKWIETRTDHLRASSHARDQVHYLSIAVKNDGRILGVKDKIIGDIGVGTLWPHSGVASCIIAGGALLGPYKIREFGFEINCVVTNKCTYGAYRGFGQPEAAFAMESMLDNIARELHVDPIALRNKNMLTPAELPYQTPLGLLHDAGDYPLMLKKALDLIGYEDFRIFQQEGRRRGRLLGIGVGCNIEVTLPQLYGLSGRFGGHDAVSVRVNLDGSGTVCASVAQIGTGIETALAQVAADSLSVRIEEVRVIIGDSETTPFGLGSFGSRSGSVLSAAIINCCQSITEKIFRIASSMLHEPLEDLEQGVGEVYSRNEPARKVSFEDIARVAYHEVFRLPEGMEPGLECTKYFNPPNLTFLPDKEGKVNPAGAVTSAAHAAIIEIDPDTGSLNVSKYVIVDNSGVIINPKIFEGQVVGGWAQGIGGTIFEEFVYDSNGQLLSSTLMDYLLPTALDMPRDVSWGYVLSKSSSVPGGFKGIGEGGTISVPAAVRNAVADALSPFGAAIRETPFKPEVLWRSMRLHTKSS